MGTSNEPKSTLRRLSFVLAIVALGILVAAPAASAQSSASDQYPGPRGIIDEGGFGPGLAGGTGAGAAVTGDGGGELPFTGYPLSLLILLLLLLLATGLAIRVGIAIRDRLRAQDTGDGPPYGLT